MENILSTILTLALIGTLWENCLIIFAAFLSDGKINALLISPHTEDYLLQMVIYPELMAYWKSISPENPLRRIIVSSIYNLIYFFTILLTTAFLKYLARWKIAFISLTKWMERIFEFNYVLASLDVLFTNVPIELVSESISKKLVHISCKTNIYR